MPPIAIIIAYLCKYGPDAYAGAKRLAEIIKNSGHPDLTAQDIADLEAFGAKSSEQYLADAGGAPAAAPTPPA